MSTDLSGATAIVTGAASGIGRATARRLAAAGATVCCADLSADGARATVAGFDPHWPAGIAHALDVADDGAWRGLMARVAQERGSVQFLVNAAGIVHHGPLDSETPERFRRLLAVNVDGTFLGMQAAFRAMRSGSGGAIVNVASMVSHVGAAGFAAYCASKAAVRSLTQTAALEAVSQRLPIRVNAVSPGNVDTPMIHRIVDSLGGGDALTQLLLAAQGGRYIAPEEVAEVILFLLSPASSAMNGAEVRVDCGAKAG